MKDLKVEIENLKKEIEDIYDAIIMLQTQDLKLLCKFKELEDFWYED